MEATLTAERTYRSEVADNVESLALQLVDSQKSVESKCELLKHELSTAETESTAAKEQVADLQSRITAAEEAAAQKTLEAIQLADQIAAIDKELLLSVQKTEELVAQANVQQGQVSVLEEEKRATSTQY